MLQAIIFDVDGTLLKTEERQFDWFKYWAKENNKNIGFRKLSSFMKFYNEACHKDGGVQNVYDELGLPCDMKDNSHSVWPAYTKFNSLSPVKAYGGIVDAVREIRKMGALSSDAQLNRRLQMGINTTNKWKNIYPSLKREGLIDMFDFRITRETLDHYHGNGGTDAISKPSKISLALSLGMANSEGQYTLHIGDTRSDLSASQKVVRLNPSYPETLNTIGVSWGYEGRVNLEKGVEVPGEGRTYFNHIVDSPSELVNVVKKYLNK